MVHGLRWPSWTVQWVPGREILGDGDGERGPPGYNVLQCVLGATTDGQGRADTEFLIVNLDELAMVLEIIYCLFSCLLSCAFVEGRELLLAEVVVPPRAEPNRDDANSAAPIAGTAGCFRIVKRFSAEDDIEKAKILPQRNNIVATMQRSGMVEIFDTRSVEIGFITEIPMRHKSKRLILCVKASIPVD